MFVDLTPIRKYRDYRLLFVGQLVSFLGSMASSVVIPYQVYEITKSSLIVGLIGIVQIVPLVIFGLWGGSLADAMDRRKLMLYSELLMALCTLGLLVNSLLPEPSVLTIFVLTALLVAAVGFHRPAMEALSQKIVEPQYYAAIGALGGLRFSVGSVVGPALGGALMAWGGAQVAYAFDFATFFCACACIYFMRPQPVISPIKQTVSSILEGLRFAVTRPALLGTYIVDIVAMCFAFPTALFPAIAEKWGGATAAGLLFSAMSCGALAVSLLSGWSSRVKRHGLAVILSASLWGLSIVGLGYAPSLYWALVALFLAGATDGVSALFRSVIWNQSIPNEMRGRLAGVEMISYMTGPMLGNARAGFMASVWGNQVSIVAGGVLCILGVSGCAWALPGFRRYLVPLAKVGR